MTLGLDITGMKVIPAQKSILLNVTSNGSSKATSDYNISLKAQKYLIDEKSSVSVIGFGSSNQTGSVNKHPLVSYHVTPQTASQEVIVSIKLQNPTEVHCRLTVLGKFQIALHKDPIKQITRYSFMYRFYILMVPTKDIIVKEKS